jgi:hypothetical protein
LVSAEIFPISNTIACTASSRCSRRFIQLSLFDVAIFLDEISLDEISLK